MLFVPELRTLPDATDELPIPRLLNQLTVLLPALLSPLWRCNWRSFAAAGVEIKFHFQAKVLAFSFTLFFAYPHLLLLLLLLVFFFSLSLLPSTTVRRALLTSPANQQQQQQHRTNWSLIISALQLSVCACSCVYACVCVCVQAKKTDEKHKLRARRKKLDALPLSNRD